MCCFDRWRKKKSNDKPAARLYPPTHPPHLFRLEDVELIAHPLEKLAQVAMEQDAKLFQRLIALIVWQLKLLCDRLANLVGPPAVVAAQGCNSERWGGEDD